MGLESQDKIPNSHGERVAAERSKPRRKERERQPTAEGDEQNGNRKRGNTAMGESRTAAEHGSERGKEAAPVVVSEAEREGR